MTLPQAFDLAAQHHQAGRLADAEALYRQILAVQPNHADALHLLGLVAYQVGRLDLAEAWIRQALLVNPQHHAAYSNLGETYRAAGRLDEAIAACRRALEIKPDFAEAHLNIGAALRERGQLDEALAAYHRALELKPDFPEAHLNLGSVLREQGQLDEAIAAYRRATQLRPDYPEAHNNLGNALREKGLFGEAIDACRRALELRPDYPEACNNLGAALNEQGRSDEAIAAYRRAIELKPDIPQAHYNLGNALLERGQLSEAVAAFHHALRLKPGYPEAENNLGAALKDLGQLDEAIAAYRRALQLKSDHPEAHNNLGVALKDLGHLDEAIAAFHRALGCKPDFTEAYNNLGIALTDQGQLDEAVAAFHRALELQPDLPEAHNHLGNALNERGQLDDASAAFLRALELQPDYPEALNNYGTALKGQGQLDEAIAAYRRALERNPGYVRAHSNLVFTLHFHPGSDGKTISEEHQRWNRQFSDPLKPLLRPHANDPTVGRRLRVGYVSPDFRDHVVGRYVLPLFERHDQERFEVLCYSGPGRPDWITERLRALAVHWRNTAGVPDAQLAEMIREDGVDILVDLTMHTADNRLPVFARQPAPVQVTWLAYPGSTGLPGIRYRLTDAHMDPPGSRSRGTASSAESPHSPEGDGGCAESRHSLEGDGGAWSAEEPVRLPDCWCCYDPAGETPEITALPALSALSPKSLTFGSLNNFVKVHDGVLALWARVLAAVPGSRLLLLCPEGRTRERVRAFFSARGITPERLEFVGRLPRWEYLRLCQQIDLALDPFPFNGMTTTCDALWMGAPVLTLPGAMPASRAGLSLLSTIGLEELAASSEDDYVRIAVELAENLPRLANLRATLRARMQASPLMDAPRFARNIEAAYRSIWQRWCASHSPHRKD